MDNDLEIGPTMTPEHRKLLIRYERLRELIQQVVTECAGPIRLQPSWSLIGLLRAALAEEKEEPQPCTCPRPSWNRTHGTLGSTVRFGCQIIYPTCPVHGEKEEQGGDSTQAR